MYVLSLAALSTGLLVAAEGIESFPWSGLGIAGAILTVLVIFGKSILEIVVRPLIGAIIATTADHKKALDAVLLAFERHTKENAETHARIVERIDQGTENARLRHESLLAELRRKNEPA